MATNIETAKREILFGKKTNEQILKNVLRRKHDKEHILLAQKELTERKASDFSLSSREKKGYIRWRTKVICVEYTDSVSYVSIWREVVLGRREERRYIVKGLRGILLSLIAEDSFSVF